MEVHRQIKDVSGLRQGVSKEKVKGLHGGQKEVKINSKRNDRKVHSDKIRLEKLVRARLWEVFNARWKS